MISLDDAKVWKVACVTTPASFHAFHAGGRRPALSPTMQFTDGLLFTFGEHFYGAIWSGTHPPSDS